MQQHLGAIETFAASTTPSPPGGSTLTTVVVSGLIGLVVGLGIAWFNHRKQAQRESDTERNKFAREALLELQTAGETLRNSLISYHGAPDAEKPTIAFDQALAHFEMVRSRIDVKEVRDAAEGWRKVAVRYYSNDPQVSVSQETSAWNGFVWRSGSALRAKF